jgi:hypothetical protein
VKKSTAVAVLAVILLLAALTASFNAVVASRSYMSCASRLASEAPPEDRLPPESFRRLSRELWGKRDMYLSRLLANECAEDPGTAPRRFGRRLAALGTLVARLPSDQRENLAAILIPAHGGRGLTYSAQTEWGRPAEALTDAEMTWLFVVGQAPGCSRTRAVPERDQHFCASTYERLRSQLRTLDSAAPAT